MLTNISGTALSMIFALITICLFQSSEVHGLSCYQGQTMMGQAVNSSLLTPCTFNAFTCVKQEDFNSRIVQRGCQTNNCTNQQGQYSSAPICTNMTQPPYLQQCCCYGDGCNSAPSQMAILGGWPGQLLFGIGAIMLGLSQTSISFKKNNN
ncbi:hypothetical protein DdX_03874 [Ditylenchus destructor]|uniref:Uncharacterized protein n=1 Tax=Ditylenchus destructor TaxID=166010 RepID=A0AAD4NG32_9BILA|nr:hypothetical protein DdX_03874 [Ditylenchus destructor]